MTNMRVRRLAAVLILVLPLSLTAQLFGPSSPHYLDLSRSDVDLDLGAQAAALFEVDSGSLLYLDNAYQPLSAASLAKIATLFLVQVKAEAEGLGDYSPIGIRPAGSWRRQQAGAVLFGLESGQEWPLQTLLSATAALSAADTTYALADYFGPGTNTFLQQLNSFAYLLGLHSSTWVDVDGWDAGTQMSAYDAILLTDAYLRSFPDTLSKHHSAPQISLASGNTQRANTNLLLTSYPGADGVKTGYTEEAGFNMVSSALRNGRRLLAVVMGLRSRSIAAGQKLRAQASQRLLDYGFENFTAVVLDRLPQIRLQTDDETWTWEMAHEGSIYLSRYYPTLAQQRYRLIPDRLLSREQGVSAILVFEDEEGLVMESFKVRLQLLERSRHSQRPLDRGVASLLAHRGKLIDLLVKVAIELPRV